uniref:Ras-GAP domain-containing protein n=3 Tax=Parascaris univalens TaxID=6257 RepID=A0A915ACF2_PARUN
MSVMGSDEGEASKSSCVAERNELLDLHDCFHGFISKKEAETRLLESGVEGALLLRAEQNADLSKQKYTLSWLSPTHLTVMHYPITLVCGDCFLFGRPFPSLLDLIQNFIEQSDLPVLPLRPPSPVEITNRQRMAILPFNAITDSDELSFCEGDLLTELQQVDDQWIWARLEKNAQSGLVAVHLTVPLNDKRIPPEELPYFHEGTVDELARRLNACGAGSYLIRTAMHQRSGYALMVNSGERIEKFLVCRLENGDFELGGRIFATVPDIIDRYSRREICGKTKLVKAVLPAEIPKWKKPEEMALPKLQHLRSHSSCPHPVACAHAFRKNKEDKWKACYVMLSDVLGPQLFLFESEKRAKPKLVLDLCYCFVYKVDESVDDRPNCLHVQLNSFAPSSSAHLSFQTEADFLQWFCNLRTRCFGCRYSASPFAVVPNISAMNSRLSTFIYITIVAYRGSSLKPDNGYSACVIVNSVRVVRTRPVAPSAKSCVSFETDFLIEHIPGGPCGLQLQLCCHNLLKYRQPLIKDTAKREISSTFTLPDNGTNLYVSADDCTEGFLFRAARHRLVVLPEEQYSSFFVLLTSRSFMLCQWIASQLSVFNRKHFARLLLSVLLPDHSLFFTFLDAILDSQLQNEREETLFRGDSFCSCCVSTAVHMIGRDLVVEELIPIVQQLHCEKAPPVDAVAFVRQLSCLISRLPPLFAAVFAHVAEACRRRFPNTPHAPRRALSAFLILRFINPILTLWNTSGGPARELAKSIQAAANQASSPEFDAQSSVQAVSAMAELMDCFIVPSVINDSLIANPFVGYSKSDHLAMLAFHVDRVLQQRSTECPLSEAYTVLRLLKAHELRFISSL